MGNRKIKNIKVEINKLKDEIAELRGLYKEQDKEFNRQLNMKITSRYKEIFKLYKQINNLVDEMYD